MRFEESADRSIEVDADEPMLSSTVGNLLSNALKFTRDGGLVTVRTIATRGDVTIEVEDECGGLPGPVDALFEPYVQRSGDRSGAGLGLTVARDVALAHKGELTARDLPGKGCVFVLKLPRGGA
jgi:signal transduction histidine kinase